MSRAMLMWMGLQSLKRYGRNAVSVASLLSHYLCETEHMCHREAVYRL